MKLSTAHLRRAAALFLALLFCITTLAPLASNGAYSYESARTLLNSVYLCPQQTGYSALDARVAQLLAGFRGCAGDTFELLLAAYDWLVYNVTYDSSLVYYPYYDFNSRCNCPVPYYAVTFAYEPLFEYQGVCDSFTSAFVVMARAIGLDAYCRAGSMVVKNGTVYSHVWCEIMIDGTAYIFDPQADNSVYASGGTNHHYYFGRPSAGMGGTYIQDSSRCAALQAAFTPVGQLPPENYCYLNILTGGNGSVGTSAVSQSKAITAAKVALWNTKDYSHQFSGLLADNLLASKGCYVTLTAEPQSGASFLGWFINNTLVGTDTTLGLTITGDTYVEALFSGERFRDVPSGAWYYDSVYFCFNNCLMAGTSITTFAPSVDFSRAMAVCILAQMAGVDTSAYTYSGFTDVREGSWYAPYVAWARAAGITSGYSDTYFGTYDPVTREQLAAFMYKLSAYLGYGTDLRADLSRFPDNAAVHAWARDGVEWACDFGLISGTADGMLLPGAPATRAQAAAMIRRYRTA